MTKKFMEYVPLNDALRTLQRSAQVVPKSEMVPLGQANGRILFRDIVAARNIPAKDSAHMDGYAVRSSDLIGASDSHPVELSVVKGTALGVIPRTRVRSGEAHTVLTGGFMPPGSDTVVQVEKTRLNDGRVVFMRAPGRGEFVYPAGRDVSRGDTVLPRGREIRGSDLVLLGSLGVPKVAVYRRPRVAILPTGNELTEDLLNHDSGKVIETHSFLLSRLIEGAGGVSVLMPIARDDLAEITDCLGAALRTADVVLTLAGSSVGDADLTENAIDALGKPGVLVHGMKLHRGRVMGFGAVRGKPIIILPGPIQGAANAFSQMAYPLIRSFLGRGFESPPSIPAKMGNVWDAGDRYPNFTKAVYVKLDLDGDHIIARASTGETEKITFLTQNDGYMLLDENTVSLKEGDSVRVYLLPGLSPYV